MLLSLFRKNKRKLVVYGSAPLKSLIAGTVETEETAVASQRLGNHIPAATNTYAIEELLNAVFSVRSV
jgi:hypothetical protein